jgi:predicted enzyme related to lactoylglutathione lyase
MKKRKGKARPFKKRNRWQVTSLCLVATFVTVIIPAAPLFAQTYSNTKTMENADSISTSVNIRYFVRNIDSSVNFYHQLLGFNVITNAAPGFAMLSLGKLHLLLNKPGAGGAGKQMPDGTIPEPGGWNRIQLTVQNLEKTIEILKKKGARFRNELVVGNGGKQILLIDPSDNLIELFEPSR